MRSTRSIINARQTQIQYNSPTDLTIRNPAVRLRIGEYDAGTGCKRARAESARLAPKDAGFGAATGAQNMRNLQLQIRFQF